MQRSAVIPSLLADDAATARLAIASLPARCALVELRADRLDQAAIREIVGTTDRELIVTVRTAQDGGEFDGTEAEREGLLRAALEAGSRFIDVEWGRPIAQLANGEFSSRVVLSHHAERIDETELERRLDAMQASGAARLKCVIRAERLQDNEIVQRQLARRRGLRRWTIFAAGAAGRWSRLMSPLWGGWGSYAALDNESTTAPHQWTVRELLDVYRIDEIGPETGWIALLGSSVSSSSPSPSMHNAGYAAHGIDRRYVALDAEDWPAAAAFVERVGLKGLTLTMPFKRVVFERCDEVDSIARACGAVNTVTIRAGGDRRSAACCSDRAAAHVRSRLRW
jgi:3-dehydroquinate dehydratase type I